MMTSEGHYDEEVLIALLDEAGEEALDRDPHIATCPICTKTAASVRELAEVLKSPDIWNDPEISPEPNRDVVAFLSDAQADFRAEDAAADSWVRSLLAQPREAWAPTLHAHPEWRTAGMVRKMIEAMYRAIETHPPDALELTSLAVETAEALPPAHYGESTVLRLRGHAWRERAYALYFTGSYNEAVWAVERARKAFAECGYAEFDDARAAVVFALICAEQERYAEGLAAVHDAARVFEMSDSRAKVVAALRTEAILLWQMRRFSDVLEIYRGLESESLTVQERAAVWQNIALCYRELGNFAAAGKYFANAIEVCTKYGMLTSIAKMRWHLGSVLLAQGQFGHALEVFRSARDEFVVSDMAHNVAEITTDIAHALVIAGRPQDVAVECRRALEYFVAAGLSATEPAMTAISLMRETAVAGLLNERVVEDIRFAVVQSRPPSVSVLAD